MLYKSWNCSIKGIYLFVDWISKMWNTLQQPWWQLAQQWLVILRLCFAYDIRGFFIHINCLFSSVRHCPRSRQSGSNPLFCVNMCMCIGEFPYLLVHALRTQLQTHLHTYIDIMSTCVYVQDNAVNTLSISGYMYVYVCIYAMCFAVVFFNEFLFNTKFLRLSIMH